MDFEYDPSKDASNLRKHGISLSAAAEFDFLAVVRDDRHAYLEDRFNGFGLIEGIAYCLTFTVRDDRIRAISLRRARAKEFRRYVD